MRYNAEDLRCLKIYYKEFFNGNCGVIGEDRKFPDNVTVNLEYEVGRKLFEEWERDNGIGLKEGSLDKQKRLDLRILLLDNQIGELVSRDTRERLAILKAA